MGRILICADSRFPKGDAGANRIQYIAKALIEAGHTVFVIACGLSTAQGRKQFSDIWYRNVSYSENRVCRLVEKKITCGLKMLTLLKKEKPTQDDIVVLYGSNSLFLQPIVEFCRKKKIKTYIDVVEWHQPFQYTFGKWDPRYWSNNYAFEKLTLKAGNVIVISELLRQYYVSHGCVSEVFPIMIDSTEHADYVVGREIRHKIHLIYPGNPQTKDDFRTMIKGIAGLSAEFQKRMVFHVTGAKQETLLSLLEDDRDLLLKLEHCVKIHGWMEYEELVQLYKECDFLYMSRPDNRVTQANFPSKMPELMAYGIIPMGTKVGDYINYLHDGVDSIHIEENTPEACTAALTRAIEMEWNALETMRVNAQVAARENFDYRRWVSRLADFVNNI